MLYLRCEIDGVKRYIDLFPDEDVFADYSFAEIQDITAKNSPYSKSFNIPGSKNNNDIFQHFYNFNIALTDYDIRNAFEASFELDGYEILTGYIRLQNANITVTEVEYNVTFYSQVGLLSSNIGDKVLADLNFSGLSYPYTISSVTSTLYDQDFQSTQTELGTELIYMLANYGYDYDDDLNIISGSTPIIDYRSGTVPGYFDYIGSPLRYYYLKPAVQTKWIYEKIFSEAGYSINSDFFNTAYFKRFFLPFTFSSDSLYLNQSLSPQFHWINDQRITNNIITSAITWTNTNPSFTTNFERVLQLPEIINNINGHAYSNYTFVVPSDGNYTIRVTFAGFNPERYDPPYSDSFTSSVSLLLHQIEQGGHDGTTGTTVFYSGEVIVPADQAWLRSYTFNAYLASNYDYAFDVKLDTGVIPGILNYAELEILDGPRYVIGNVDLSRELPPTEEKQIDFITGINKRFNLVVVPEPGEKNVLRVEPIVNFIGKGDVLDWSKKIDYNSTINISPTTSVINGTLYYSGEKDEDYGNTEFNKTTNNIYGTQYVQLNTDYKSETTVFNDGFTNAVDDILQNINSPNITIPIYYITREENNEGTPELYYNSRKTIPRIVFRGLNLPAFNVGFFTTTGTTFTNSFYLEQNVIDMFPVFNRFTTYPFGLTGFTHAVNFNKRQRFNRFEYDFSCYEDLYDIYYEDYIQDLTNPDNRILVGMFYLLPEEIAALKGNERIFISGNYYRINKIANFNLTRPALVEVELIKLTKELEPHRTRYFKLVGCANPFDIKYGNTDLNYTLWAYVGKKINIGGTCYTILRDDYRDNVTYERFTTTFQSGSFLPLFFNDCGCTQPINSVQVYDELSCSVPQPTPIIPTGSTYVYYVLEKCNEPQGFLGRSTTYYPVGTVVRLNNGICYVIVNYTTIVNTNDIIIDYVDCEACAADIPTPTPTRTQTPTPTPTPPPCDCLEYTFYNANDYTSTVEFIDCYGSTQIRSIGYGQYYIECVCDGTVILGDGVEVISVTECTPIPSLTPSITPTKTPTKTPTATPTKTITPTPTKTPGLSPSLTPTKTPTPTPTPSPGPCVCTQYIVQNEETFSTTVYYTDCYGVPRTILLGPFTGTELCACDGSVFSETDITITELGGCVPVTRTPTPTRTTTPTRTPTKTPTPTPTPSPVGEPFVYFVREVTNCTTGAATGAVYKAASYTSFPIGTFVNLSSIPSSNCAFRINSVTTGVYDDVISGSCGTSVPVSCCC
jgi:hypothetical protein